MMIKREIGRCIFVASRVSILINIPINVAKILAIVKFIVFDSDLKIFDNFCSDRIIFFTKEKHVFQNNII